MLPSRLPRAVRVLEAEETERLDSPPRVARVVAERPEQDGTRKLVARWLRGGERAAGNGANAVAPAALGPETDAFNITSRTDVRWSVSQHPWRWGGTAIMRCAHTATLHCTLLRLLRILGSITSLFINLL